MTFDELLASSRPTDEELEQAVRFLVGQETSYMLPEQMETVMVGVASRASVDEAMAAIRSSPSLRRDLCVDILRMVWHDPGKRKAVENALEGASEKMPVVEAALITMIAMYGMYLVITDGRESEEFTENADGSTTRKTVWRDPVGPLKAVVALFTGNTESRKHVGTGPDAADRSLPSANRDTSDAH